MSPHRRPTREYSEEYPIPATRETRRQIGVDVPEALYKRIKAKAARENISLRALVLRHLDEWSAS